ncbi:MAG TPA: Asp-tRNA(Asn)/Glu-tRNA(Gln) amidotransferase subunit GatA [Bryobacteraceae bacterium]|jgi:aspartyl-tRNA(Asn)/glutamyl-tRNA(Gln) amidotransferase subunit A|nr:Asp-tRNA(Asn)/Glu-tRNA(Gln) amidotransferase subunit GatA [Bryobacteraceae bacterium]
MTISSIRQGLLNKNFSAAEIAREALAHGERENPKTNAFLLFSAERALEAAERVDSKIATGEDPGALAGVPIAVKDVILTKGLRTTCASRMLEHYIPHYDATAVARLEAAGGVVIGKTNCDEFAMGSSNENSAFGPVRNPVALDRVPGGTSGGSAAAVAQGTSVAALGSDTGGSIRQPASFCGVVGVTPTYGRVSRYGLVAHASSLDHIGSMARNVKDAAAVLGVISGRDPLDSTSAGAPVPDYTAALDGDVRGLKLGVPIEYMKQATGETAGLIRKAIEDLRNLGCEVRDISLPATDYAIAAYYIISTAEASANLARFDGARYGFRSKASGTLSDMYRHTRGEGFGPEVKRRIMLGTYVLSHGYYDAYYLKAQKVRALVTRDFTSAFQSVDAIVAPVSPFPAFRIGEKVNDPLDMYLSDIYTITGSLAGIPCMSVPCGATAEGLPVGLQILCNHFEEAKMFRIGDAFERARA